MTDREMLELAANAAGLDIQRSRLDDPIHRDFLANGDSVRNKGQRAFPWNPLADDGDALRLAVKLHIGTDCYMDAALNEFCCAWINHRDVSSFYRAYEAYGDDPLAATRRAIVRTAAELGKAMP